MQQQNIFQFNQERFAQRERDAQRKFWLTLALAVPLVFALIGAALGLIFYKNDTQAGLLLLSHALLFAAGAVSGANWRNRKPPEPAAEQD